MEVFEIILVHFLCRRLPVYFVLFVRLTPRDGFYFSNCKLRTFFWRVNIILSLFNGIKTRIIKPFDIISRLSVDYDHTVTSPIR